MTAELSALLTPAVRLSINEFLYSLQKKKYQSAYTIALESARVLLKIVAHGKWTSYDELVNLIKREGKYISQSAGNCVVVANTVRRVLKLLRDEHSDGHQDDAETAQSSIKSFLTDPNESTDKISKAEKKDKIKELRQNLIDLVREYSRELESVSDEIVSQAQEHISKGDCVVTVGFSNTVGKFLKQAAKKRQFRVLVSENAPVCSGVRMVECLTKAKIECQLIKDDEVMSVMPGVTKMLIGADAVFMDGSIVAKCGALNAARAAQHYRVPVLVCAASYKLTPIFCSCEEYENWNVLSDPTLLIPYTDSELSTKVQCYNPMFDFVPLTFVTLFVTNMAGSAPTFVYKLMQEQYHPDDYSI